MLVSRPVTLFLLFSALLLGAPSISAAGDKRSSILHPKKRWIALTALSVVSAYADSISTMQGRRLYGAREEDPLANWGVSLPRPATLSVTGALALGVAYVGHRMETSNVRPFRRVWWLPQTVQAGVNLGCAIENERKIGQYRQYQALGIAASSP